MRRQTGASNRTVRILRQAGYGAALGFATLTTAVPARADLDPVLMWNTELISVIRQTSALLVDGPPEVARQIAIVGTAMSDAVSAASGLPYTPYAYTGGAVTGASAQAAALAAGHTAMTGLFSNPVWSHPTGGDANLMANTILPQIDTAYNNALASLGSSAAVTAGISLGNAAGAAILAARANDGAIAAIVDGLNTYMPPGSGTTPGVYIPPSGRPAMYSTWGTVTPFGVTPAQGTAIRNAAATSLPALDTPEYAAGLLETQCMGGAAGSARPAACAAAGFSAPTQEQVNAALFWNDPSGTLQPPGHWLQIANTLMQGQNLSLLQQARLTSLLGMGLTDAGIYAWAVKYDVNLWRPFDAIRACDTAANDGTVTWNGTFATCDATWQSAIATPPHPDYVAGHPAFSAAAATILQGYLGVDGIGFCSTSDAYTNGSLGDVAELTLCFNSLSAASNGPLGSTYSRILGGIHTPFAVDDAEDIGTGIGQQILANLNVSPIPEPASLGTLALSVLAIERLRRRRARLAPAQAAA
ncbi:MAG: vanadium-dependent haloperoxidase [Acetobacteraceae bacterium]